MLDFNILTPQLVEAFAGKRTLLDISTHHSLDDLIEAFYSTRPRILDVLEGLTDSQVAFTSPVHPFWSISETVTHLIFSQGLYHNKLLDVSTSQLPHAIEAARGMGEGAKTGIPAEELRQRLAAATADINAVIEDTRYSHDPEKTETYDFFGVCNYKVWVLILLSHELDHLRQMIAMRRVARAEAA
jgi:uncharacterized damage-inducible protein DinB